ncbi:hypothetical protein EDB89DRAFT_2155897 [Lactarius sanguifluus]|nr:hypothetical protein EDB89DRAFT_2155897 [Lactarius sanguifluus]
MHGPYKELNLRNISQNCNKKEKINMLPEDVLLEIFFHFGYDVNEDDSFDHCYFHGTWHTLVHVCQRWRQTIFASSRRLDLKLLCTNRTPVRKNLAHFPALPIVIRYDLYEDNTSDNGDNLCAALEHPDRVFIINLYGRNSQLGNMATMMQESFPLLTVLWLMSVDRNLWDVPAFPSPDGFLGGSTPRLQEISLYVVPFPGLPTLLSSTKDLVILRLERIPVTGYISPEAMVWSNLPASRNAGRAVLPALTSFKFQGACEYLEELVSRIDSHQLNKTKISILYSQLDDFRVSQLVEFISRSGGLQPILFRRVNIASAGSIHFSTDDNCWSPHSISISRKLLGWNILEIASILGQFSTTLSSVAHLKFHENARPRQLVIRHDHSGWECVGMGDTGWLPFLQLFTAVQTLYIPEELSDQIALALEDGARQMVTEVLPALSLLYLENQPASSVETFIAVRQDSGRPVTIVNQKAEFDTKLQSYLIK